MTSIDWAGILAPNERILWQGRPGTGLSFNADALAKSAFGLFFFGFSIFWIVSAFTATAKSGDGSANVFPLFGIPFVAVGFYLVIGQYFWSVYVRGNTWYSLSDQRAFIARQIFGTKSLKSYPIAAGTPIEIDMGDTTSMWFAEHKSYSRNNMTTRKIGFELITGGNDVYQMIRKIQAGTA